MTVLRAGIVVGHGGISWEMTRQLVAHLPAMVTPRWVHTRTQPIAVADVVRYLVGVLEPAEAEGRVFDVGGPEVLTYLEMLHPGRGDPEPAPVRRPGAAAHARAVVAAGWPWSPTSTSPPAGR